MNWVVCVEEENIRQKSGKLIKVAFLFFLIVSAVRFPVKNITNTHVLYAKISGVPTE